jgi:CRISPR-associated protein Csb2
VTPIELDRYPDDPFGEEAEATVVTACERVGLPRPASVVLAPASVVLGAPPASQFARVDRPGKPPRPRVHAIVTFSEPVAGPVLLGAGRYHGIGLCRPV